MAQAPGTSDVTCVCRVCALRPGQTRAIPYTLFFSRTLEASLWGETQNPGETIDPASLFQRLAGACCTVPSVGLGLRKACRGGEGCGRGQTWGRQYRCPQAGFPGTQRQTPGAGNTELWVSSGCCAP